MKLILLATLSLVTLPAQAQLRGGCTGNRGQVSLSVAVANDRLYVEYGNVNGAADFPIYEGVVTRATFPFLEAASQELASISTQLAVSWPVSACQLNPQRPELFHCDGVGEIHAPKRTSLRVLGFSTGIVSELRRGLSFETFKLRWQIEGEGLFHLVTMPFNPRDCGFRSAN